MERYFRQKKLIDRENDMSFLLEWFEKVPDEILWIYGPKSSGKTTLIEYVVENELFEDFWKFKPKKNYWIRYMNLREYLISSYDSFIEAFVKPTPEKSKKTEEINARINIGIFEIEGKKLEEVRERKRDLFKVMAGELQDIAKNKRVILIIDEIQTLQEIYMNGDRELLKEFLNFCVRLTKELHLCHVVILSSNTVFIDRIYNDAKLKVTSEFYKIEHLDKGTTIEWLKEENFSDEDISLIWEYLGGCIPLIQRMMRNKDRFNSLEEFLKDQQLGAWSEIIDYLQTDFDEDDFEIFDKISKDIVINGKYILEARNIKKEKEIVEKWCEKEMLFFEPRTREVRGNNRLYEKGLEKYLKQYNII